MSMNVLVVDDSRTMRALIIKTLKLAGLEVDELFQAADGGEALEIMEVSHVDLVLSDINMPGMNGVEMIEKMNERDLLKEIPLIVLSTEGSDERITSLKDKGIRAFLRKPFSPEALREVVDGVVETIVE